MITQATKTTIPGSSSCIPAYGVLLGLACLLPCQAQAVEIQNPSRPGDRELPEPSFEPAPDVPLVLPPVAPSGKRKLSSQQVIFVKAIKLLGNQAIPDAELRPVIAPYENKQLTATDLLELRDKLTLEYINRGYINSGVIIQDQEIVDSTFTDIARGQVFNTGDFDLAQFSFEYT